MKKPSLMMDTSVMEENVLVFKTNIQNAEQADKLQVLADVKGITEWSTDLEDCENILRVVGYDISTDQITRIMDRLGFYCEELAHS